MEQLGVAPVDHQVTTLEILEVDDRCRVVDDRLQQLLAGVQVAEQAGVMERAGGLRRKEREQARVRFAELALRVDVV